MTFYVFPKLRTAVTLYIISWHLCFPKVGSGVYTHTHTHAHGGMDADWNKEVVVAGSSLSPSSLSSLSIPASFSVLPFWSIFAPESWALETASPTPLSLAGDWLEPQWDGFARDLRSMKTSIYFSLSLLSSPGSGMTALFMASEGFCNTIC